jgi:hypothetical protein
LWTFTFLRANFHILGEFARFLVMPTPHLLIKPIHSTTF